MVSAQWDGFLGSLEQIGIPRVATTTWVTWPAVAIRLRANALFNQTPGPARERRSHERPPSPGSGSHARVARDLLPGHPAGAALHLLARRHPQRRVLEPRRLRRSPRTSRCRSSSSTRAGATSRRIRNALVMVPDPDTGQGWLLRLRFVRSETDRAAVRSHGAADRGDRVVLRPEGHLQAARGRHLRSAVDRAGARGTGRRAGARPRPGRRGAGGRDLHDQGAAGSRRLHQPRRFARDAGRFDPARPRREPRVQVLGDPGADRRARRPRHDRDARLRRRTAPARRCGSARASPASWPRRASRSGFQG